VAVRGWEKARQAVAARTSSTRRRIANASPVKRRVFIT